MHLKNKEKTHKQAMELDKNALAYSATTLAATMMNSIFNFYYVKIFLNVYRYRDIRGDPNVIEIRSTANPRDKLDRRKETSNLNLN